MTVQNIPRIATFTGDSFSTLFRFAFRIFTAADFSVTLTTGGVPVTLIQGVDYNFTVHKNQNVNPGGTITYPRTPTSGSPITAGQTLTVNGVLAFTQTVDLQQNESFAPNSVEDMVDRNTILAQQVLSYKFVPLDGSVPMLGNLQMGGFKVTGMAAGTVATDAVNVTQFSAAATSSQLAASSGSSLVGFIQSGTGAVARTVQDKDRDIIDVRDFGATGDGATNDSAAFTAAFAYATLQGKKFVSARGTFAIANVNIAAGCSLLSDGSTFKKAANGFIFSMKERTEIFGAPVFDGNYSGGGFTGVSIDISVGANVATYASQGHQTIWGATFRNSESYHVSYPNANLGWMSRLVESKFVDVPANAPASVMWPDEPAAGGNRYVIGGFSAGPVVDVNGTDNGIITNVTIGSSASNLTQQGVYFRPSGTTTNLPKKIIITDNRFAYGTNTMTIVGIDHMICGNINAGAMTLAPGTTNCVIGPNRYSTAPGFTDNSGALNEVYEQWQSYTPTVVSGITVGNGVFSAELKRDGTYVEFRMDLVFGTATSVSGVMVFNLPIPTLAGTRGFLGQAVASAANTGIAYIDQTVPGSVRVLNNPTAAAWNATVPRTWTTGDTLNIQGRYRIG